MMAGNGHIVERSPNRHHIDRKLLAGESPRQVSAWLLTIKNPETISHTTLNTYRKKYLNVQPKVVEEYQKRQAEKEKEALEKRDEKTNEKVDVEVNKQVGSVEALDKVIAECDVPLGIESIEVGPDASELEILNAKIKAKRIMIQAARARHEILKDEPAPLINVNINQSLLESLLNRENEA